MGSGFQLQEQVHMRRGAAENLSSGEVPGAMGHTRPAMGRACPTPFSRTQSAARQDDPSHIPAPMSTLPVPLPTVL